MGKYADRVVRSHGNMSAMAIREQKNQRSKARSAERRAERRLKAEEINEGWRSQTLEEQIATLDRRLGKGVGAKKQRARIAKAIEERDAAKTEEKKKKRSGKKSGKHS